MLTLRATDLAHSVLRPRIAPGSWVIDATAGNGHDALWLAELVGPSGRVFVFDVQAEAIAATAARTGHLRQVTLFHAGHERMKDLLPPEAEERMGAIMFNLGYLPGAGKSVVTHMETTLDALTQSLDFLAVDGAIATVLYPGHAEGAVEAIAVREWARHLPPSFAVARCARLNTASPPPEVVEIVRVS